MQQQPTEQPLWQRLVLWVARYATSQNSARLVPYYRRFHLLVQLGMIGLFLVLTFWVKSLGFMNENTSVHSAARLVWALSSLAALLFGCLWLSWVVSASILSLTAVWLGRLPTAGLVDYVLRASLPVTWPRRADK